MGDNGADGSSFYNRLWGYFGAREELPDHTQSDTSLYVSHHGEGLTPRAHCPPERSEEGTVRDKKTVDTPQRAISYPPSSGREDNDRGDGRRSKGELTFTNIFSLSFYFFFIFALIDVFLVSRCEKSTVSGVRCPPACPPSPSLFCNQEDPSAICDLVSITGSV